MQEKGLGGRSDDLSQRLSRWQADRGSRSDASRKLAAGWAKQAQALVSALPTTIKSRPAEVSPAVLLALGYPDMVARRRDASGEHWLSAGGRGYILDPISPLASSEWIVVADAQGQAKGARILSGLSLTVGEIEAWFGSRIDRRSVLRWNDEDARVEARLERRLGAITLASGPDPAPDAEAVRTFLLDRIRNKGLTIVPLGRSTLSLLRRARFSAIACLSEEALLADLEDWLGPLLTRRLNAVDTGAVHQALRNRMTWEDQQRLDRLAPALFTSPARSEHGIDYDDEGGPSVEVRVQALFGLDQHPGFGSPAQPLLLKLTSPAGRPLQTTRDLPGFWRGSWRDVQRDMKGRYPRHRWPDEPWREDPSLKTRNAFEAQRRS
jgi:ATP-dependent helicase HrpB